MRMNSDRPAMFFYSLVAVGCVVAAILLWPVVRWVMNRTANYLFERSAMKRAATLRGQGAPKIQVRQTDIAKNMTGKDRALYKRAQDLLAAGQIVEGAHILESIKFQRAAIDALEKHGHIDEACAMLVRLNAPHRAGAIYERNNRLDRAAHFFTLARQFDNAGRIFLKMAAGDFRFLHNAADSFEKGGKIDDALAAFASLLATDKLLAMCRTHRRFGFLVSYLREDRLLGPTLSMISPEERISIVREMTLTPQNALTLATWSMHQMDEPLRDEILKFVGKSDDICRFYWRSLDAVAQPPSVERLVVIGRTENPIAARTHARALESINRWQEAARVHEGCGDGAAATRCRTQAEADRVA
jgi:hypothetical protein